MKVAHTAVEVGHGALELVLSRLDCVTIAPVQAAPVARELEEYPARNELLAARNAAKGARDGRDSFERVRECHFLDDDQGELRRALCEPQA